MSQSAAQPRVVAGPPPGRYRGRSPEQNRRGVMVGAAVMVLLMLGFAVWMGVRESLKAAHWQDGTFSAVDDGTARLEFTVTTTPGRRIVCSVQMLNPGLTEVGRKDVTVGPSQEKVIKATATIPTFERASSGKIRGCAEAP
jgi:hypothetical protein